MQGNKNARLKGRSKKYDATIPPRQYKVRCTLVWLSNLNFVTSLNQIPSDMRITFEAICSRGGDPMWIDGPDTDIFRYTIWLATKGDLLRKVMNNNGLIQPVSRTASVEAVNWFNQNRNRLRELSPRTLAAVAGYIHNFEKTGVTDRKVREIILNKKLLNGDVRKIVGFGELHLDNPPEWGEK